MKSMIIAICLITMAQCRQSGGRSRSSSLSSQGTAVRGSTGTAATSSRFGASSASTRFGGSAGSSMGFGQSAATGASTGTSTGFDQSSPSFGAQPSSPVFPPAAPSSGSASMDRPTFEQPAAPQAPQAPAAPQFPEAPAAGSGPMACFSADANRISMAKCPMADAQNKCVNMPNCVWGLDALSASAAASSSSIPSRSGMTGSNVLSEQVVLSGDGQCEWDMEGALDSVDSVEGELAADAERQRSICASYDEVECNAAAKGLKEALCFWTPRQTQNRVLDDVHRAVVSAMNAKVSALDLLLGVAFLITAAFGMHQFQQWCKAREHSKYGMAAKAEWNDQGMHIPIF